MLKYPITTHVFLPIVLQAFPVWYTASTFVKSVPKIAAFHPIIVLDRHHHQKSNEYQYNERNDLFIDIFSHHIRYEMMVLTDLKWKVCKICLHLFFAKLKLNKNIFSIVKVISPSHKVFFCLFTSMNFPETFLFYSDIRKFSIWICCFAPCKLD